MIFEISLVGRLTGADISCALLVLYFSFRGRNRKPTTAEKQFYLFALLWFVGLVFSDLYRETPFGQYARGWAKIFFFVVNFTAIRLLIGKNAGHAVIFVFLLLVASAIKLWLGVGGIIISGGIFGPAWKFGYGTLFAATVLLLSTVLILKPGTRIIGIVLPFLSAAFSLVLNARNLFGTSALAALVMALTSGRKRPFTPQAIAVFALIGGIASYGLISVYSYTASQGMLGQKALEKYEAQSQGDLGIVLGGRSESLDSIQAIMD